MPILNFTWTLDNVLKLILSLADIFIVWFIIYYVLRIVRNNSRTVQIFKGILFVLIVDAVSKFLGLKTVEYFADMFINWGFLALIIIFQPEIRSILERMGKSNVFNRIVTLSGNEREKLVDQIVTAVMLLSKDKTGALISIERSQSLEDYISTGTRLNSDVTAEILTSIFVTTTPLHDGAVIIQGDKIACASAYFPPTNLDLPGRYGARHRAAVGISEVSDAVTVVVSEETGNVSITDAGHIYHVNEKELRDYLLRVICDEATEVTSSRKKPAPKKKKTASLKETLTLKHQPEKPEEKIEELEHQAESIKLPQNHKHDRPVPSYPKQTRNRVTPMSVSRQEELPSVKKPVIPQEETVFIENRSSQRPVVKETPAEENTVYTRSAEKPVRQKVAVPKQPEVKAEPAQRMTSEQVAAARRATVAKLKHNASQAVTQVEDVGLSEEEKKFDTTKIDISKVVGFDSELDKAFDMLEDLPSKKKTGGDK